MAMILSQMLRIGWQSIKKRCEVKGLIGIPTGIDKLDEITNGWLWGEELVVVTGAYKCW